MHVHYMLKSGKANLKRWVLSWFLKEIKDVHCRMHKGRAFHSLGPATLKALSPIVHSLVRGTDSRWVSVERSGRDDVCGWRRSERKGGAKPLMDLKTRRSVLK